MQSFRSEGQVLETIAHESGIVSGVWIGEWRPGFFTPDIVEDAEWGGC